MKTFCEHFFNVLMQMNQIRVMLIHWNNQFEVTDRNESNSPLVTKSKTLLKCFSLKMSHKTKKGHETSLMSLRKLNGQIKCAIKSLQYWKTVLYFPQNQPESYIDIFSLLMILNVIFMYLLIVTVFTKK